MCSFAIVRLHYASASHPQKHKAIYEPQLHVTFNIEEILKVNAPWLTGCRLQHESTKLRVKGWCWLRHPDNVSWFDADCRCLGYLLFSPLIDFRYSSALLYQFLISA